VLDGAAPQLGSLGPLAAASETVRHVMYGVSLGLIYPLRLARFARARVAPGPRRAAESVASAALTN
jgi:hypothetical protein